MRGIYTERDVYEPGEWSNADMSALFVLGVKCEVIKGGKLKILEDTSEISHDICGDEDCISALKRMRGRDTL